MEKGTKGRFGVLQEMCGVTVEKIESSYAAEGLEEGSIIGPDA